jgi:Tol biopolymer transport system component
MGGHELLLNGLSPNCAVAGASPRPIEVPAASTIYVNFDIDCFLLSGEMLVQSGRSGVWHLYRQRGDGTDVTDLTPDIEAVAGDWSPDGSRIAFSLIHDQESVVATMNADGSDRRMLDVPGSGPKWSPDGTRIAFTASDETIRVMNADGSGIQTLATGRNPDWTRCRGDRVHSLEGRRRFQGVRYLGHGV